MKELVSSNDVVFLSFAQNLLSQELIEFVVLDQNMSLIEGSIGILPRRIMVSDDDLTHAQSLLSSYQSERAAQIEAELGNGEAGDEQDDAGLSEVGLSGNVNFETEVTDDQFLGGGIKVYQPKTGFRSGIDAILLASSVRDVGAEGRGIRVLEAGCGAGVVSLAIAKRCTTATVHGIEIEQMNAEIAMRNVSRNNFSDRVSIFWGDLTDPVTKLEILGLKRNSYDFVVANPPFYKEGETQLSSNPLRRRARRAFGDTLEEWVRFMTAMAAPKGIFSMIHRAERLDEILTVLEGRFGGVRIFPLFSKANMPANRVLVQGVKGSRAPLKLLPGLVMHDATGAYSADVKAVCETPGELSGLFV